MNAQRILVVDDEEGMLEVCHDILTELDDVDIIIESSSLAAARLLETEAVDLLISDIRMEEMSGLDLLRAAHKHDPDMAALMITAYPSVDSAIESLKLGAADYITKPFQPAELLSAAQRLLRERRLRGENRTLMRHIEKPYRFDEIIAECEAMQSVFQLIERFSAVDIDVLVVGETGTGKELVAHAIHSRSARSSYRFVPVDCGTIPESLTESELFGHERGAFTGAHLRKIGLLEVADKGTLFLDEIGELSATVQAKLLRVLQERKIRRVGGNAEIPIDVRVIAATNQDLPTMLEKGTFREDLYYRINVARVKLPPLRERGDDIVLLAHHFTRHYAEQMGRQLGSFDDDALEVLSGYAWPGNVRQLQNVIKSAAAMATGSDLHVDDLPEEIVESSSRPLGASGAAPSKEGGFFASRETQMLAYEASYLTDLLKQCGGDVTKAAVEADVPRGTLYRLFKKHAIQPREYRP